MFGLFEFLFPIFFIAVFGIFIVTFAGVFIKSAKQNRVNRASPTLDVRAKAAAKRMEVRGDHSHTYYYVTFEVASGDRMEFAVEGSDYGMIVEGDIGDLTFKGNEFLGFKRV